MPEVKECMFGGCGNDVKYKSQSGKLLLCGNHAYLIGSPEISGPAVLMDFNDKETNKITWKGFLAPIDGLIGEIQVFRISEDLDKFAISRGDPPYKLTTCLPMMFILLGKYHTIEKAKKRAEIVLKTWLDKAGLKQGEGE